MTFKILSSLFVSTVLLSACNSTPPAKDFSGDWAPVNQMDEEIREIPLYRKYSFTVMPIDKTLKNLLTRWAEDSSRSLEYGSCFDYSLPKKSQDIRSSSLDEAIFELNQIYAEKGVVIRERSGVIVLEPLEQPANYSDLSCL